MLIDIPTPGTTPSPGLRSARFRFGLFVALTIAFVCWAIYWGRLGDDGRAVGSSAIAVMWAGGINRERRRIVEIENVEINLRTMQRLFELVGSERKEEVISIAIRILPLRMADALTPLRKVIRHIFKRKEQD